MIPKKPKQQKKVYNHGNLFNDDPFPEFVVTNNPFENRMIKATNKGRDINEQTSYIDKKYKSIMSSLDDVKPSPKPSERPIPKPRTYKPVPAPRFNKLKYKARPPVPTPRNKVNQLVQHYETDIIEKPVPTPRLNKPKYKPRPPVPTPRNKVNQLVQHYENNIIEKPVPKPVLTSRTKIINKKKEKVHNLLDDALIKITKVESAHKDSTKSSAVDIIYDKDPLLQLTKTRNVIEQYLNGELIGLRGFQYIETLKVTFEKQLRDEIITKTAYFNGRARTIINENEIDESLQLSRQQIMKTIGQWLSEGSGWTIKSVDGHYINLTKYKPLKGSSYIELPIELRNPAKGLINLKNKDNECFRWCHIRHLNPQEKYPQRIKKSDKEYIDKLDYQGIKFPVTIKQINKIEKQNNIRINVFSYEEKQPYPIYVSKEKFEDHIELLLITKEENKHYVLIKDFNKFMYQQTKHKERKHFCMHCLQCFSSERVLNNDKDNCIQVNGIQAVNMPEKGDNILKFNNFHKQQPVPFVIYADFEAITEKVQGCQPNNDKSYTEAYQKHTACGYGYKVVCCYDDKYTKPINIYRGEKAVNKFMEKMLEEVKYCKNIMKKEFNKPLRMTKDNEDKFQKAEECHICNKQYTEKDIRVRDHCHITGKYRGSAHQECNLKLRMKPEEIKIPVIFHNLKGYDSHFIMQEIGAIVKKHTYKNNKGEEKQMNINAIPNNMEKYMAFMLGNHLTFIDSFQFMSSSLEKLVSNLPRESLKYTSQNSKVKD